MTKQEILEAIDSTIVANDKKAITAESLANILREIATATPEGGGNSGGEEVLKFLLFDPMFGPEILDYGDGVFSRDVVNAFKEELLEGDATGMYESIFKYYDKIFDNNAVAYSKLKEAALAGKGVQAVVDMSEISLIFTKWMYEMQGIILDEAGISAQFPATAFYSGMSYMGEFEGEAVVYIESELLSSMFDMKGFVGMILHEDGGFSIDTLTYILYIPKEDYILEEAEIKSNTKLYNYLTSSADLSLLTVMYSDGYNTYEILPLSISTTTKSVTFLLDTDVMKATLSEDGSVTTTKIGSINTTA